MNILITGGAGFIGSNLATRLVNENHKVSIIDNLSTGKFENIKNISKDIKFINEDIINIDSLRDELKNIDVVFHFAAKVDVTESIKDPIYTNKVNLDASVKLLKLCSELGVKRFIFSSSAAVYGNPKTLPINEKNDIDLLSPYAIQKYTIEKYCEFFSKQYAIDTISLRFFNVYGPKQSETNGYAGVICKFINNLILANDVYIDGDGEQTRDFIYIDDLVNVCNLLLSVDLNKNNNNLLLNIGSGTETSVLKLFDTIKDVLNSNIVPKHKDKRLNEIMRSCADISKLNNYYEPKYSLEDGLSKTIAWYRDFNS